MSKSKHNLHKHVSTGCAVLIISDTRTRKTDESGKLAKQLLVQGGQDVIKHEIVKNDKMQILSALEKMLNNPKIKVIVTSGGTGISERDVTIETVSELLEKKIDGFGELFRRLSYNEIGEASMLSRAVGGSIKGKVIFCLPGSKNAVKVALEKIILPGLGHIIEEVDR